MENEATPVPRISDASFPYICLQDVGWESGDVEKMPEMKYETLFFLIIFWPNSSFDILLCLKRPLNNENIPYFIRS